MSEEVAWAAGLFEGEGCVSVGRRSTGAFTSEAGRTTLVLTLVTTDLDVMERFIGVVKCGYVNERPWYRANGYKPSWRWQTKNLSEVESLVDLLYPYMGERRRARMDEVRVLLAAKLERRRELGREQLGGKRKTIVRDALGRYA